MFALRRTAARALSATPAKTAFIKPRTFTSYTPSIRASKAQPISWFLQRRFASDVPSEDVKTEAAESAKVISEAEQEFAQTTPEAPVEENVTPAQESVGGELGNDLEGTIKQQPFSKRAAPSTPNTILYVGNLFYEVQEGQLQQIFERFGTVKSVKLVHDNRGMSRGFGYVEFENVDDARSAIEALNGRQFEGRTLVVNYQLEKKQDRPRSGRYENTPKAPTKTLFIGNMSFQMTDKDLNDLFRDVRNVMDVRVAIDRRTGQPRGFCHADFLDEQSAEIAKAQIQGQTFYDRSLRVDYSESTRSRSPRNDNGDAPQE
ncbi:hypothetical protein M011DRAFT_437068 [Sporormia fimetaria CBS 119925]|uniref:RRM domain-containing protein n=1 Tax=Sporormia fimetaria CBS 119925 TaxID=1340428 RepID=A0A6A6VLU0_9PLEO|nr:hypothetical protein M011DRAFT_437068 [Sporormia fimetaria CBS 119925]